MCKHFGCAVRHPPPGQPRHNPVVERKVGIALQGISCCLLTAGSPNVFWPMVGHAFVVNYNLMHRHKTTGDVAYEATHGEATFTAYIPGELVFFMPAQTIISAKVAKVESNLVAGIFLDYYMGPDGKFSGQYICVCLEDFVAKNLHRRVDSVVYQCTPVYSPRVRDLYLTYNPANRHQYHVHPYHEAWNEAHSATKYNMKMK